jgi:hypothetical protein
MSITHPAESVGARPGKLLEGHDQLRPALLAVAIAIATVLVALVFTGLPQ